MLWQQTIVLLSLPPPTPRSNNKITCPLAQGILTNGCQPGPATPPGPDLLQLPGSVSRGAPAPSSSPFLLIAPSLPQPHASSSPSHWLSLAPNSLCCSNFCPLHLHSLFFPRRQLVNLLKYVPLMQANILHIGGKSRS